MEEQQGLRRALRGVAAAAVAARHDPQVVFDAVARHLAELLGVPVAAVGRLEGDRMVILGRSVHGPLTLPDELGLEELPAVARVAAIGQPAREEYVNAAGEFASRAITAGLTGAVAVPILVGDTTWGMLAIITDSRDGLPEATEELLAHFADLVSLALINAEAWRSLHRQAMTDGLTGVLNHRGFYDRLRSERQRSVRHRRPLTLAMFDLDGFKALNDSRGHGAGDRALQIVTEVFSAKARASDVVGRLGGDELAVIVTDADADVGLVVAERLRASATDALVAAGLPLTLSCGVADLADADTVDALVQVADVALYMAKANGRDQSFRYGPDAIEERSYEQLLGGGLRSATQAVNLAITSKNGAAREHSEEVARVAVLIAARLGRRAARPMPSEWPVTRDRRCGGWCRA